MHCYCKRCQPTEEVGVLYGRGLACVCSRLPGELLFDDHNCDDKLRSGVRMIYKRALSALILCFFLSVGAVNKASADLLDMIAGNTIENTISEIEFLIDKVARVGDSLAEKYSKRLEAIIAESIDDAFSEADALREAVKNDVDALRESFFDDVSGAIWEAECTAIRLSEGTFQDAVTAAVSRLVESDPALTINIFGFDVARIAGSADPNSVSVPRPDIVYYRFRNAALASLESRYKDAGPNSPAFNIYSTLLEISQLARQTSCRFPGNVSAETRFIGEHARFGASADLWDSVVTVQFAE